MTRKKTSPESPTASLPETDPWSGLSETGDGLTVDNFLTTFMSQVTNALRRSITLPYAQQFDLTIPEWRLLSLLAHAKSLPFAELVLQSTSDKALVSRTLRLLEKRGFVEIQAEGNTPRKRLICFISAAGEALHEKIIPLARRSQAEVIRIMTPEERRVVFHALKRVQQSCLQNAATDNIGLDE
ncbi:MULTISPECIES: MarR family winged helix-turn-helix transcriptional regulator [Polaromonas]|uniref:MarR family winged helix-turn-helix transcriptional regulator n=1 Tax=Polaromonas aquatica TaxID=332657 RepID=A0ABW1U4N9_9BURK